MSGEAYVSMEAFDATITIRKNTESLLHDGNDLRMTIDSKKLLDTSIRRKCTPLRTLAARISAAGDTYKAFKITAIRLVADCDSPVDALSKAGTNGALHWTMSGVDRLHVVECIICNTTDFENVSECETGWIQKRSTDVTQGHFEEHTFRLPKIEPILSSFK